MKEIYIKLPKPGPSAGLEAYTTELKVALALDPRKKENYEKYKAPNRRDADIHYLPVKMDIENVSRCNYACSMCIVKTWKNGRRASDMTLDTFKKLIDEQYGLVEIKLNGLGEPTLQGDTFFEMIKYARDRRIWVRITTNASLLHVNDNYKKLIDSGVNEIDISIDGADKNTYESIRKRGNFETVVKNCKLINDYTNKLGICRTKMWTVVQENNFNNLSQFVPLASTLGFKHLAFSLNLHGWADADLLKENLSKVIENKLEEKKLFDLVADGKKAGVCVSFWTVNDKFDASSIHTLCPWPFERAVVTSDSRVVPCCMIGNPDAYEIGRGIQTTFSDIWFGKEYQKFRQDHLSGNIPAKCKLCYK